MRRAIVIFILLLCASDILQADDRSKVRTNYFVSETTKTYHWTVRGGVGYSSGSPTLQGFDDISEEYFQWNLSVDYQRLFNGSNMFWGIKGGLFNLIMGYYTLFVTKDVLCTSHLHGHSSPVWEEKTDEIFDSFEKRTSMAVGPELGYLFGKDEDISVTLSMALQYAYAFDAWNKNAFRWTLNGDVWFKNFGVGLEYMGYVNDALLSNGIVLNLGYRF